MSELRAAVKRLGLPGLPGAAAARPPVQQPAVEPPAVERGAGEIALVVRCTAGHLPYARVLGETLARFHPEIDYFVVVMDPAGEERLAHGRLVPAEALGLERLGFLRLALAPAQLCMASKPAACRWAASLGYRKVLSFDADIALFAPMDALLEALERHRWVVTPHLAAPFPNPERRWEHPTLFEIGTAGTINNGLFGFRPDAESLAFLAAWEKIVLAPGAFLDHQAEQNAFNWLFSFDRGEPGEIFVLRDPAYNVAYWNLHERALRWTALDGGPAESWQVEGRPLVAFHFSGLPAHDPWRLSVHDYRHSLYLLPSVTALVEHYRRRLAEHGLGEALPYPYAHFPSGVAIDERMRRVFQRGELLLAGELDPFSPEGEAFYCRALLLPAAGSFLMPALLGEIYRERPDVQVAFPEARVDPRRLLQWFCAEGAAAHGYLPLLDRWRPTVPRREPMLHLAELVAREPSLGAFAAPLGADRQEFAAALAAGGHVSEASGVRGLDAEIWVLCPLAAVHQLVASRADLRAAFPDYLGSDAEALASWLEGDGVLHHGLPAGFGERLRAKADGRALGRIYSFYRRHRWLQESYPLAFVGEDSATCAAAILERWPADCEFDLDDVAMFLWTMDERPLDGLEAAFELPTNAADPPARLRELALRTGAGHGFETSPRTGAPRTGASRLDGVNCFGYFKSPIGLGNLSRGMAVAIEAAGFPVARQLHGIVEMSLDLRLGDFLGTFREDFGTNVFVSYPHLHSRLLEAEKPARVAGRRNIVYLAWEQRDGHPHWREVFGGFDQIWALSEFAAEAIGRATGREVLAVPAVVDFEALPPAATPVEAGLDPRGRTFLYVFDANSSIERKNPAAAISAFARAFRPGEPVELVLKASHGGRFEHRRELARLRELAARTGLRIRFETRHLPRRELMRMISAATAYVSLHRAEGFGYTCAEAMAYGVPVIATGYSGNLDFMDETSAYLVRAGESLVTVPDGPFQRGSVWAEPDVDHAAELMRQVYEDESAARAVGARGAVYVREKLALARIAGLVAAALRS